MRKTEKLLLALMVSLPCLAGAIAMAERLKVAQILQPTGKTCETYYSLHASDIVCLKDAEYRRLFRVTYKFAGEIRVTDLSWYPRKNFQ